MELPLDLDWILVQQRTISVATQERWEKDHCTVICSRTAAANITSAFLADPELNLPNLLRLILNMCSAGSPTIMTKLPLYLLMHPHHCAMWLSQDREHNCCVSALCLIVAGLIDNEQIIPTRQW